MTNRYPINFFLFISFQLLLYFYKRTIERDFCTHYAGSKKGRRIKIS
ncbi:hypothetical protein HMPREF2532_03764 [Bacteroides ovatus]|nr:hypothetical protein HMPREF2532_03764 [Bacteroides ovatus]